MIKKNLNVEIDADIIARAKAKAALLELNLTDFISMIIKENTVQIENAK